MTVSRLRSVIAFFVVATPALALDRGSSAQDTEPKGPTAPLLEEAAGRSTKESLLTVTGPAPITDLISNRPDDGTFTSASGAPIQCEPVLGPFHGLAQDLTRCQSARYFTPVGDSNKGEYGTLLNMISNSGFPTVCARNTVYPAGGTCLNDGGKMYRVQGTGGQTAITGSGPKGKGDNITDGSAIWAYEPNFSPGNGGKSNFALMTYQKANSGAAWTASFGHQIAQGGLKKNATTLELDLNNYWGDYDEGITGPSATALQIFTGGRRRSSKAIGIGQYNLPSDPTALVNGIELCCATLVRDNTILDITNSSNGFSNIGNHTGSAFSDGGRSALGFNAFGTYSRAAARLGGKGPIGLDIDGTYSVFQIKGAGWSVNSTGTVMASGIVLDGGGVRLAEYTFAHLFPCVPASRSNVVSLIDGVDTSTRRQIVTAGGGAFPQPIFCDGAAWRYQ